MAVNVSSVHIYAGLTNTDLVCINGTLSGKRGLIAYLKVSRDAGFKYLVCCSSPMVETMCTKFSHVLQ